MSEEFQREVIDRLARIEERTEALRSKVVDHAEASAAERTRVRQELARLAIDAAVAKSEGKKSGRAWGAGVGAALVTLAEVAKAFVR